jgi:hypothetical protein
MLGKYEQTGHAQEECSCHTRRALYGKRPISRPFLDMSADQAGIVYKSQATYLFLAARVRNNQHAVRLHRRCLRCDS